MSNALPLMSAWSVVATPVPTDAPSLNVAELLGALSHALDLTEGQPKGHCQRACWIGTQIGMQMGLTAEALSDIYFTALLKDLGCSSNAARICELYLADDISFKRDFKTIDGSLAAALRFVMDKTGIQSGFVCPSTRRAMPATNAWCPTFQTHHIIPDIPSPKSESTKETSGTPLPYNHKRTTLRPPGGRSARSIRSAVHA